jgi:hypothetical protein
MALGATYSSAVSAPHQLGTPDQRPPPACRPGLIRWIRGSMVFAAPTPAAAGQLTIQCRQSRAWHAGHACSLPLRQLCHLRRCHSSAKPLRLHAHAQHHTVDSMHSSSEGVSSSGSGGGSSRRIRRQDAGAVTEVRLHSAQNAVDVNRLRSSAGFAGMLMEQHPTQSVQSMLRRTPVARLLGCRAHWWLTATLQ